MVVASVGWLVLGRICPALPPPFSSFPDLRARGSTFSPPAAAIVLCRVTGGERREGGRRAGGDNGSKISISLSHITHTLDFDLAQLYLVHHSINILPHLSLISSHPLFDSLCLCLAFVVPVHYRLLVSPPRHPYFDARGST